MLRKHSDALRIIDANRNRLLEALRVLEEAARFVLDCEMLCAQAKEIRHNLTSALAPLIPKLVSSRRIETDAGKGVSTKSEFSRESVADVVAANASRVKESLRVLEEYSKILDSGAARALEEVRYDFYSFERKLLLTFSPAGRLQDALLCAIVSSSDPKGAHETARLAIEGGADIIQLREKGPADAGMFNTACELRCLTAGRERLFIINDRADIAAACGADGVHVGADDIPVAEVRRLLGPEAIIGASAHTPQEGLTAAGAGADYLGVGSLFATETKTDAVLRGMETFVEVQEAVTIPCFGVGGVNADNIVEAASGGVRRVAVASGISRCGDPQEAARKIKTALLEKASQQA